jgi:hypothetical protein
MLGLYQNLMLYILQDKNLEEAQLKEEVTSKRVAEAVVFS